MAAHDNTGKFTGKDLSLKLRLVEPLVKPNCSLLIRRFA
jgi:hypothetical protein